MHSVLKKNRFYRKENPEFLISPKVGGVEESSVCQTPVILALESSLLAFRMSSGSLFAIGGNFAVALPKMCGQTEHYELQGVLQEQLCKCDTHL